MNTNLAISGYKDIVSSLDDLLELGRVLVKSGMLPQSVKSPEAAVAIMLKGREIGMPVMESFALINVIQGKPTIAPQGMLALIRRSGLQENIMIEDDGDQCIVTMKRKGESPHTALFSMGDAKSMGLLGKDNWNKQPKTMRQWRAIAACARVVFPDIIGGMYLPEEMGIAVNDDGEVVGRDITGWSVADVIANLPKDEDQKHIPIDMEAIQVTGLQSVVEEQGPEVKLPIETQSVVEMISIDLGNGKQKSMPRASILGVKVANSDWFKNQFLNHKHFLDKNDHPVRKHFDNYLRAHFGINSPVNLTWEMLVAMQNNLAGKGNDSKYFPAIPQEDGGDGGAKPQTLSERVASVVGLSTLVTQWQKDYHLPLEIESDQDFADLLAVVLEGIEKGHFKTDSPEGLSEIDREFRASFKSETPF